MKKCCKSRSVDSNNKLVISLISIILTVNAVQSLEEDAKILRPAASLIKSLISAATLGVPSEIEFEGASDMARNFVAFSWRTGFPMTMPANFTSKARDFFYRIWTKVEAADVKVVQRKTLANLKTDLDAIVDAIEDQVRQSPDGLYTNYEQVQVNGVPLGDALFAIGLQFKAYGVDVSYYRNIAAAVLGIPVLPTMAATFVEAANRIPNLATVANLTAVMYQTGNQMLPGVAAESMDRLRSLFPGLMPEAIRSGDRILSSPLSLFRLTPLQGTNGITMGQQAAP